MTTDEKTSGSPDPSQEERAVRTEVLATLPVEVEVVIGHGVFSVGEISSWRVGEVVELPSRIGEPALIRAGGRPIARGELCDVEGQVGVRITERL